MYVVYKITNNKNGKIYIGSTAFPYEARIYQHITRAKRGGGNHPLYMDMAKFGIKSFKFEEIERRRYRLVARDREMYWIKKYGSITPNGYNIYGPSSSVNCLKSKKIGSFIKRKLKNRTFIWLAQESRIPYQDLLYKVSGFFSFTKRELNKINKILNTNY